MTRVFVEPGAKAVSHDIALIRGEEKRGLILKGRVQEDNLSPSTIFKSAPQQRFGDYDPSFSEIQQDTWVGGVNQEEFHDDSSRYRYGRYLWSLTPGRLFNAPIWRWADGDYRDYNMYQPGDATGVTFLPLIDAKRYLAQSFVVAAQDVTNYAADKAYILLRRRGTPGTLTVELWTDSGGDPDAIIATITASATTTTVPDTISRWLAFDWTGTTTLTHGSTYHIVVYGASTDDEVNHWEVGVDDDTASAKSSAAGSSWATVSAKMYYRVVDADVANKWHGFFLYTDAGALTMLAVNEPPSGTSEIYVWDETNDEWDIIAPSNDLSSQIVKDVAVSNNIAFMALGNGVGIYQLYDVSATWTGYDQSDSEGADRILASNDPVDGPQIWRAENNTWYVSRASLPAAGADLSFGSDIEFPPGEDILHLETHNDQVWARTQRDLFSIKNDRPVSVNVGLDAVVEPRTYDAPLLSKDLFLYLGWAFSLERLYGGTIDDIGPHRGAGLPDTYQGKVSALAGDVGLIWAAIDGGTGNTSSVFAATEDGTIYHPIWEAWETGQRVRNVWVQPQDGTTNPRRLWISVGTDMVYIDMPDESLNPLRDSDSRYVWESVIETSSIPIRFALPKLYKSITIISKSLGKNAQIGVDYQLDDNVGSTTASDWIWVTDLIESPKDIADLNLGNAENIRFRFRLMIKDASTPVEVLATVLKGVSRTPLKRQYSMNIELGGKTKLGDEDHDPFELITWLRESAVSASALRMQSPDPTLHDIWVFVDNPSTLREWLSDDSRDMGGSVTLVLREA